MVSEEMFEHCGRTKMDPEHGYIISSPMSLAKKNNRLIMGIMGSSLFLGFSFNLRTVKNI